MRGVIAFALLLCGAPASAQINTPGGGDKVASMGANLDLKSVSTVLVPCGNVAPFAAKKCVMELFYFHNVAPFAAKKCVMELFYFQSKDALPVNGNALPQRILARCQRVTFNGQLAEKCEFIK